MRKNNTPPFQKLRWKLTRTYTLVTIAIVYLSLLLVAGGFYLYDGLTGGAAEQVAYDFRGEVTRELGDTIFTETPNWEEVQNRLLVLNTTQSLTSNTYPPNPCLVPPVRGACLFPRFHISYDIAGERPIIVVDGNGIVQAAVNANNKIGTPFDPALDGINADMIDRAFDNQLAPSHHEPGTRKLQTASNLYYKYEGDAEVTLQAVAIITLNQNRLVRTPDVATWRALARFSGILLVGLLPVSLLFGTVFGYVMARPLTGRLRHMQQTAAEWQQGNLDKRIHDNKRDEIGALSHDLSNMAAELQAMMQSREQLAAVEERNHLARELHDTVKQANFSALMQVRAARNFSGSNKEAMNDALLESENLLRRSLDDLDGLILQLRPAQLEGRGIAEALHAYVESWAERVGISAETHISGDRALPLAHEQALLRIAQEALANIARHSQATTATVRLTIDTETAALTIHDNGRGFSDNTIALKQGFGLQTMRERAESLDGTLAVDSKTNGVTIEATIPVPSSFAV